MAFQQPIPRPARRIATPPPIKTATPPPSKKAEPVRGSQEWILFSPDKPSASHKRNDSLHTPATGFPSRLSDFSSLGPHNDLESSIEAATEDLDSLDDGLVAFNEPSSLNYAPLTHQSTQTILPTHDGLGMFPGSSSPVQEQFWNHERYNPKRRRYSLRRSSVQRHFEALENNDPQDGRDERFQRIERWRMDQSRAIMQEIERETARRRRRGRLSVVSTEGSQRQAASTSGERELESSARARGELCDNTENDPESFWGRFTRRVIRGLLGLDDNTLSYIFGEALPVTAQTSGTARTRVVQMAEESTPSSLQLARMSESWESRLLARIAKELGSLVHQISEHPGAFSTYLQAQSDPPYAGLPEPTPIWDETADRSRKPQTHVSNPHLSPTLRRHRRQSSAAVTDPSLWGIEEEKEEYESAPTQEQHRRSPSHSQDREYWERDLDIKMVFGYLRSRITTNTDSLKPLAQTTNKSAAATVASSARPDSLRRAALIKHHHPLVSRNLSPSTSSLPQPSPILGRRQSHFNEEDAASSCASQSTKRSKTRHSGSLSLGSSRNYWDIGAGSLGSGPAGVWGEV